MGSSETGVDIEIGSDLVGDVGGDTSVAHCSGCWTVLGEKIGCWGDTGGDCSGCWNAARGSAGKMGDCGNC